MKKTEKNSSNDFWYASIGNDQDVVVSTRASIARNLANFPFPKKLSDEENSTIQSIVFDAFNHLHDSELYESLLTSSLDELGHLVMKERGIIQDLDENRGGLVMRSDGKVSCTVNINDHVVLSSFYSGFNLDAAANLIFAIDNELQKFMQYAASYDFGYLTSNIMTSGSGLVCGIKFHLPAICLLNKLSDVVSANVGKDFNFVPCYGSGSGSNISGYKVNGASLGSYYFMQNSMSCEGSELDQLTSFFCAAHKMIEEERNARRICAQKHISEVANYSVRSLTLAKNSIFLSLREAIEIIGGIKFGNDMGMIKNVADTELHALLYRIQNGHLEYFLKQQKFKFSDDILENKELQIQRLRALIMHEAFENADSLF